MECPPSKNSSTGTSIVQRILVTEHQDTGKRETAFSRFTVFFIGLNLLEEPAEVKIVLLNRVLLHIGIDAKMADEDLDAVIVEEIERWLLDYGFQMFLEGIPDLQSRENI